MKTNNEYQRQQLIGEYKERILLWYMQYGTPQEQCENTSHGVNGKEYTWYLEPYIDGQANPCLVVTTMGDSWNLQIVERIKPIRSFGGL